MSFLKLFNLKNSFDPYVFGQKFEINKNKASLGFIEINFFFKSLVSLFNYKCSLFLFGTNKLLNSFFFNIIVSRKINYWSYVTNVSLIMESVVELFVLGKCLHCLDIILYDFLFARFFVNYKFFGSFKVSNSLLIGLEQLLLFDHFIFIKIFNNGNYLKFSFIQQLIYLLEDYSNLNFFFGNYLNVPSLNANRFLEQHFLFIYQLPGIFHKVLMSSYSSSLSLLLSVNYKVSRYRSLAKNLFSSNYLSIVLSYSRNNVFLSVVNVSGSILWKCSSGSFGLSGKQKKGPEAALRMARSLKNYLRSKNVPNTFLFRFLFLQGCDFLRLHRFYNRFVRLSLNFAFVCYDVRQPHGYMRLRKARRL